MRRHGSVRVFAVPVRPLRHLRMYAFGAVISSRPAGVTCLCLAFCGRCTVACMYFSKKKPKKVGRCCVGNFRNFRKFREKIPEFSEFYKIFFEIWEFLEILRIFLKILEISEKFRKF
jgi:hypothetical protein